MPDLLERPREALCGCGCGELAPLAQRTNARLGHTKGLPLGFVSGHGTRRSPDLTRFRLEDHGFLTLCRVWTGPLDRKGYARIQVNGVHRGAHVVAYERDVGPVPEGLLVDHLCRVRACINAVEGHLDPCTNAENTRRGEATKLSLGDVERIRSSALPASHLARRAGCGAPDRQ